ncbi:hypothetical protein GCM10009682_34040 [Luedemannella flava]|uniref:Uncharacterized protein n=1 Tax=Luedemannella flava TaxID=349316 RepID=A0ABP4YFF2_9ACTN
MTTKRLIDKVRRDFAPEESEILLGFLAEFDGLDPDEVGAERLQAAIVLGARGDSRRFLQMLVIARGDWRDALVVGGLANDDWPDRLADALAARDGAQSPL